MNPPAKASPAPVGSTTLSRGKAGAANTAPSWNSNAPYSPRLTTTVRGPRAWIARAAIAALDARAKLFASLSSMNTTSDCLTASTNS